jgi:hypothetical protein
LISVRSAQVADGCDSDVVASGFREGRFAAAVTLAPGSACATADLQTFVRAHYGDHLVPDPLHAIDHIPTTEQGKADRAALSQLLARAAPTREAGVTAPVAAAAPAAATAQRSLALRRWYSRVRGLVAAPARDNQSTVDTPLRGRPRTPAESRIPWQSSPPDPRLPFMGT